jgi:hypothetical protein
MSTMMAAADHRTSQNSQLSHLSIYDSGVNHGLGESQEVGRFKFTPPDFQFKTLFNTSH